MKIDCTVAPGDVGVTVCDQARLVGPGNLGRP